MTEQKDPWIAEELRRDELRQKRAAWEQEQAARKEQKRLAALRQEMEAYREERLTDWMEHDSDPAEFSQVWPQIMKDYLDGKQVERDIEREAKLGETEELYP